MLSWMVDVQKLLTSFIEIGFMLSGTLVHNLQFVTADGQKWATYVSMSLKLLNCVMIKGAGSHLLAYFNISRP